MRPRITMIISVSNFCGCVKRVIMAKVMSLTSCWVCEELSNRIYFFLGAEELGSQGEHEWYTVAYCLCVRKDLQSSADDSDHDGPPPLAAATSTDGEGPPPLWPLHQEPEPYEMSATTAESYLGEDDIYSCGTTEIDSSSEGSNHHGSFLSPTMMRLPE